MLKSGTVKSFAAAVAVAGLVASLATVMTSTVPQAKPVAEMGGALHPHANAGHVLALQGATCSSQNWPYYERRCQFDSSRPADDARVVRIIALH